MNLQSKMDGRKFTRKRGCAAIVLTTAAALFLRVALDYVYVNYVDKFFSGSFSAGVFALTEINARRLLESYAIALILSTWLAASLYRRWRPSGIALLLYFAFVILPLSSLYGMTDAPASFFYAAAGSFAILIVVTGLLPRAKIPRPGRDLVYLGLTAVFGMGSYVYGWLLLTGGLERFSIDLLSVYEVRVEYVQMLGPFLGYFVPWQAYIFNVLLLLFAIYIKRYWLAGLAAVAQLLLFGMTGHKSFLLAPVLAGGVYFLWTRRHALSWILGGAALMVLVSYAIFLITGDHVVPSLFIRRLFFVPAANHFIYYDFFSQPEHPFVMLSNSILEPFIRYPYDVPITKVISWTYWGRDFNPNVGYLGDAFSHFGFMGMFLFSIILGLFLRIVDSVGSRLPSNVVAAVIATPAMALTNSALFTSLLTHGFILAMISLWLLRAVEARRSRLLRLRVKKRDIYINT